MSRTPADIPRTVTTEGDFNTFIAEDRDAAIFRRLLKTRKNNKRARAYPEVPGHLVEQEAA